VALAHSGGDKQQAALTLGINLKTIYNRLREYRVDRSVRPGEIFQKVAPFRAALVRIVKPGDLHT
jgi:hypothetical protein